MFSTHTDAGTHALLYRSGSLPIVKEGDVLLPGKSDHHEQRVPLGDVQKPPRGDLVRSNRVDPRRRHEREIALDGCRVGIVDALPVRAKGSVGDPSHVELLVPHEEELAPSARAQPGSRGRRQRQLGHRNVAIGESGQPRGWLSMGKSGLPPCGPLCQRPNPMPNETPLSGPPANDPIRAAGGLSIPSLRKFPGRHAPICATTVHPNQPHIHGVSVSFPASPQLISTSALPRRARVRLVRKADPMRRGPPVREPC
jgi:hypothetical protein